MTLTAPGPVVNGEQFAPGYTPEAAAYEQATRPQVRQLTIEFIENDRWARSGLRSHRPVTHREWLAIERKCAKPFTARWPKRPVGFPYAPPAVLEDGRTVAEALDAKKKGAA